MHNPANAIQTGGNLRTQSRIRTRIPHQGRNLIEPLPQQLSRATSLKELCLTSQADASSLSAVYLSYLLMNSKHRSVLHLLSHFSIQIQLGSQLVFIQ